MINWCYEYFEMLFGSERPKPSVKWTKGVRILGASCQELNYVKFSIPFIEANLDNTRALQVLCAHEICHLVVPAHNADFKKLCRTFGKDVPSGTDFDFPSHPPAAKYLARCSNCGREYTRCRAIAPSQVRCCSNCDTILEYKLNDNYK